MKLVFTYRLLDKPTTRDVVLSYNLLYAAQAKRQKEMKKVTQPVALLIYHTSKSRIKEVAPEETMLPTSFVSAFSIGASPVRPLLGF